MNYAGMAASLGGSFGRFNAQPFGPSQYSYSPANAAPRPNMLPSLYPHGATRYKPQMAPAGQQEVAGTGTRVPGQVHPHIAGLDQRLQQRLAARPIFTLPPR